MNSNIGIITSLMNPQLYPLAKINLKYLQSHYSNKAGVEYGLMNILSGIDSINEYSRKAFELDLHRLGYSEDINQHIMDEFDAGQNLNETEINKTVGVLKQLVTAEAVNIAQKSHSDDPMAYISALQEFDVNAIVDVNDKVYREVDFDKIDVDKLEEEMHANSLKSAFDFLNKSYSLGSIPDRTLNMVSAPPGGGKSLYLMQETIEFLMQGKKVCYGAIGDLNEFHFITRLCAQYLGVSVSNVALQFKHYYTQLKLSPLGQYLGNLKIQFILPDKVSCTKYVSILKNKKLYDDYDVFIIDYDTNFASESAIDSGMYAKGGDTYNVLKEMADRPGKWVFVACQPKQIYWSAEILPMNSASESSRKQQIVDSMLTISNPPCLCSQNHVTIMNLAKNRNGNLNSQCAFLDGDVKFHEIDKQTYSYIKMCDKKITLDKSKMLPGQTIDEVKQSQNVEN